MMDLFNILLEKKELLTASNLVLAFCIVFHLFCEFAHYIHEFVCRKRDAEQGRINNKILLKILERIENDTRQSISNKRDS